MNLARFRYAVAAIFILGFVQESTASGQDKIRLAHSALEGSNAVWYVARERGFYKKHGLDADLLFIPSTTTSVSSLVAGDVQVANASGGGVASAIAGLTAVDGATVITDGYELLAFGVKIRRKSGGDTVEQLIVTEPVEGGMPERLHPTALGGTRHLSAAQFVRDQPNTLALVASQDGHFTLFAWSPCEEAVHAHCVEVLLL